MFLYVLMMCVWTVVGVGLLLWHWLAPNADQPAIRWTGLSAGWLCLALALYNLVRWWSSRELRRQDRSWEQTQTPVKRFNTLKPSDLPDPNFDFTRPSEEDKPPPA